MSGFFPSFSPPASPPPPLRPPLLETTDNQAMTPVLLFQLCQQIMLAQGLVPLDDLGSMNLMDPGPY